MTTITYRDTGRMQGTAPSTGVMHLIAQITDRLQQWRSERELESLSLDMRKDLGWPAADEDKNSKAAR